MCSSCAAVYGYTRTFPLIPDLQQDHIALETSGDAPAKYRAPKEASEIRPTAQNRSAALGESSIKQFLLSTNHQSNILWKVAWRKTLLWNLFPPWVSWSFIQVETLHGAML